MSILKKQKLYEDIYLLQIKAPEIAKKALPGHFVLLQMDENSPRIPIPIADADKTSITLIFKARGKTTEALTQCRKDQPCYVLLGPLGNPREIKEYGKVILVGEGPGIGQVYFYAKALKNAGNKIISLVGGIPKKQVFWSDRIEKVSDKYFIIDPQSDLPSPLAHAVEQILRKIKIDQVISFASPNLMRSLSQITKLRTKHYAYLTATMLDGIGMCGSCRVVCDNEHKLCCIDGPELDAHTIDWDAYLHRLAEYPS
ncbi:sulfide/dihydroorotate dehydrogenase-like FAD/NAD-binding protein [Candidatus Woesearchaeota archaeon]|nr:sulfide/dihydroorotate dehydrogenase-like FAD/NAD-binding protein [Candidatus Woesearchaeota archaeon]